jgi:hypothetical protein
MINCCGQQISAPKEGYMRAVKFSLTACALTTMLLGVVVANAITTPAPKKPVHVDRWTTTVFKNPH